MQGSVSHSWKVFIYSHNSLAVDSTPAARPAVLINKGNALLIARRTAQRIFAASLPGNSSRATRLQPPVIDCLKVEPPVASDVGER